MKLISGSGGGSVIDRDLATSSLVPFQTNATVAIHYALAIHGNCTHHYITLRAVVDTSIACDELRDAIFTEKQDSGCSDVSTYFGVCDVINENQSDGTRVCRMRCQCAESADQCLIHILSGISGGSRISRGGANFLRCQLTSVTSRHFTINKQKLHM